MKWDRPGHQFDQFALDWNIDCEYYLWGAATTGQTFYSKFNNLLKINGFIDSDSRKYGSLLNGIKVCSLDEIKTKNREYKIIVTSGAYWEIRTELIKLGYAENVDFCEHKLFTAVYFMYSSRKLYLYRADIAITNKCTLRCQNCNMMMPYFKSPQHKSLMMIKQDIDTYFKWVDHLDLLNLLGGEPFLYPQLLELIEYLRMNYHERIRHIEFFSNATVIPTDEIMMACSKYDISIQISDYSNAIPCSKKVKDFIDCLDQYGIRYTRFALDKWLNFDLLNNDKRDIDDAKMIRFFDLCAPPFRGLHDRKLYFCHLNASAVQAGLVEDNVNDYFDLKNYNLTRKMLLLEFDAGYNNLGYVTFCRRCHGCFSVNDRFIAVAKQAKR